MKKQSKNPLTFATGNNLNDGPPFLPDHLTGRLLQRHGAKYCVMRMHGDGSWRIIATFSEWLSAHEYCHERTAKGEFVEMFVRAEKE